MTSIGGMQSAAVPGSEPEEIWDQSRHGSRRAAGSSLEDDSDGHQLHRSSQVSNFDMESITRLSTSSQSYRPSGTAINVTRTLSVDQRQWEQMLSRPTLGISPDDSSWQTSDSFNPEQHRSAHVKFRSIIQLPMINPFSKFSLVWHMIMLIMDLTYTAFAVPIGVGFDVSDTAWTWAAVMDFTAGTVFMVDLLLGFHTGYVVSFNYKKRIVMDGQQVARWYVQKGSFWVDSLSSVAWVTQLVLVILTAAGTNQARLASQIQIMRILRLARLGRLFKVLFLSGAGQGLLPLIVDSQSVSATAGYFLQLMYAIAVTINVLGCLWYWVADREGITGTWITQFGPFQREFGDANGYLDAETVESQINKPRLYLASIYWAFTTVATVGYGDITPQTPVEQAVTIFVFLVGIIFFGVIIGSLTQLLQRASKDARKAQLYREKMEHVDRWLRGRHFPSKLRKRIRDYYIQFWLRQAEEADEAELLKELPHTVRTEALWSMSRKSLVNAPVFAEVPTPLLFLLASHVQPRMFPPGHDISLQGAPATKMWMLHFGQIVPVFNDVEGDIQTDSYLLNSLGMMQDLEPAFQRNSRGYRTVTACGLWEWNIAAVLGVCKHHVGLFEHISANILSIYAHTSRTEPESFPPNFVRRIKGLREKLEMRAKSAMLHLPESPKMPEKRTGQLPISPFERSGSHKAGNSAAAAPAAHQSGGALDAVCLPDDSGQESPPEAGRGKQELLQKPPSVTFSEDTKADDGDLVRHASQMGYTDFLMQRRIQDDGGMTGRSSDRILGGLQELILPSDVRVSLPGVDGARSREDGSLGGGDEEEDESSGLRAAAEREDEQPTVADLATSLSMIQDQLGELRALVKQNCSGE